MTPLCPQYRLKEGSKEALLSKLESPIVDEKIAKINLMLDNDTADLSSATRELSDILNFSDRCKKTPKKRPKRNLIRNGSTILVLK